MKILTIIGTRPEIIRLSLIINKLDKICHHILVHTGQNFDTRLSDIFFRELEVRKPDYLLGIKEGSFTKQISSIFIKVERILLQEKPDKILILGDTNSGLSSIVAKKIGIPVYHLEAGNRCYDESVPEEINRKIIDHTSTFLLPYTKGSRNNLLHEGFKDKSIFVIGNPIYEVIKHFHLKIDHSRILEHLQLRPKKYFLVTIHRGENVDIKDRLISLMKALNIIQRKYKLPMICSMHPHTEKKVKQLNLHLYNNEEIKFMKPFGFFDFIDLEKSAFCVLSDSGTVQEECCLLRTPNVTLRDVTERPETVKCGSNMLGGVRGKQIIKCIDKVIKKKTDWIIPEEYLYKDVSNRVIKIISSE